MRFHTSRMQEMLPFGEPMSWIWRCETCEVEVAPAWESHISTTEKKWDSEP